MFLEGFLIRTNYVKLFFDNLRRGGFFWLFKLLREMKNIPY